MKEAIELDHAIKKLKSLQKGFRNQVADATRQLKLLPSESDRLKEELEKIRTDISQRAPESKGDEFKMVLSGKEYGERREAGLELIKVARLLNEKSRGSRKEAQKTVGSYAGFSLTTGQVDYGTTTLPRSMRKESTTRMALRYALTLTQWGSYDPCIIQYTRAWRASSSHAKECSQARKRQDQGLKGWHQADLRRLPTLSKRRQDQGSRRRHSGA